jgi:hypothetical protein
MMDEIKKTYEDHYKNIFDCSNKNNFNNSEENINLVHLNLEKINDEKIARDIYLNIITHEKIKKEILTFELLNYKPDYQIKTIDDLIELFNNIIKKYQYKVGGYNIEDSEWILCDSKNNRFKNKKNQKIIYNSIEKKNCDHELIWFLESILEHIQKYINPDLYKIKYSIIEDEKNCICWIIFCFASNF